MTAIDILVLNTTGAAALGLVLDAFDAADNVAGSGPSKMFDWRVLTPGSDRVELKHGLTLPAQPLAAARPRELVIALGIGAPGPEAIERRVDADDARAASRWLGQAHRRGAEVAAGCTGVFLLGEAGILDGRACTTTWWLAGVLARRCPRAVVRADEIVVHDRGVWTAGAVVSQLDLALALIARHGGEPLAAETRRRLAAPTRLSQAPYISAVAMAAGEEDISKLEAYLACRLEAPVALADAARALGASERTLARRVRAVTGLSPSRFIQKIRLNAALRLIESTRMPLAEVAARVGLADAAVLHRLVVRHTGLAPGHFRGGRSPNSEGMGRAIVE
jgi:transcriptional regulator GlxA family with amidase domain